MAATAAALHHGGADRIPVPRSLSSSHRSAGRFGCKTPRAWSLAPGWCKLSPAVLICVAPCRHNCARGYSSAWHSCGRARIYRSLQRESDRTSLGFPHSKFEADVVVRPRRAEESAIFGSSRSHSEELPTPECTSSGAAEFGTSEFRNWQNSVAVVGRALALSCATACVAWLLCTGRGRAAAVNGAAGGGSALLTDWRGARWPSVMKILSVFKDQGLLLSVLLGLSAFFSMAETSIMTLWPWKVRELAEKEGEGGVFRLLSKDVTRFLTTILIGTTVVNIAATALVTDAATSLFGEAGVTAATGVMTVVILIVTEITPKSVAVHNAARVARLAVRPVAWLSMVLYPVGRVVTAISMVLLKFLGLKSTGESTVSEEELKLMLRGAELSGAIEEEEQDMIENVLEIKDTFVREVMTPLVDVVAIDAQSTLIDFRNHWMKHQYSRMPVFERRVDNIVGIAYAMDLLDYIDYDAEQLQAWKSLTVECIAHKPAYFVPDSMSVWNLLREFRVRKVHMAIVLNEYGGAIGVVTLEDVVEEIVGEIFDENDSKEEIRKKTGYLVQRANGVFDVDANTHIEDLSEALEVQMPEGPYRYETVSGFVCEAFGYIPRTGESISVALKKADSDDDQERREDHQEDSKEKFQKYRLEILAGNARKVGAVRFQVDKSLSREDGIAFAQSTGVFGKVWAGPAGATKEKSSTLADDDDEFCEAEYMEGAAECYGSNDYPSRNQFLIPETAELKREEICTPDSRNGNQVIDSEDWDLIDSEPARTDQSAEGGDEKNGSVSSDSPRTQKEIQEGRTARRRGSAAALALDRKYRIGLRRQEVESARAAMNQETHDQSYSENFYESAN